MYELNLFFDCKDHVTGLYSRILCYNFCLGYLTEFDKSSYKFVNFIFSLFISWSVSSVLLGNFVLLPNSEASFYFGSCNKTQWTFSFKDSNGFNLVTFLLGFPLAAKHIIPCTNRVCSE